MMHLQLLVRCMTYVLGPVLMTQKKPSKYDVNFNEQHISLQAPQP